MTMSEAYRGWNGSEDLPFEAKDARGLMAVEVLFQEALVAVNRERVSVGEPAIAIPFVQRLPRIPGNREFPSRVIFQWLSSGGGLRREVRTSLVEIDGGIDMLTISAETVLSSSRSEGMVTEHYQQVDVGQSPLDADSNLVCVSLRIAINRAFSWSPPDLSQVRQVRRNRL